jgi:hypothetical protein
MHVSANTGRPHEPLHRDAQAGGARAARRLRSVVLECYMHKLSRDERRLDRSDEGKTLTTAHEPMATIAQFREQATKLFADRPRPLGAVRGRPVLERLGERRGTERVIVSARAVPVWRMCSYDDDESGTTRRGAGSGGERDRGRGVQLLPRRPLWLDMRVHEEPCRPRTRT